MAQSKGEEALKAIDLILLMILLTSCEESTKPEKEEVFNPVNLYAQDTLYQQHLRIKWSSSTPPYTIQVSQFSDFSSQVIEKATSDTVFYFKSFPSCGSENEWEDGCIYYVRILLSETRGKLASNTEAYRTSRRVPFIVPIDDNVLSHGIGDFETHIYPGTYTVGNRYNVSSINLIGFGNAKDIVITGGFEGYRGSVMDTVKLTNLTLDGAGISQNGFVSGKGVSLIAQNVIFKNYDDYGFYMSARGASTKLTNCIFTNITPVVLAASENVTVENCVFKNNGGILELHVTSEPDSIIFINSIIGNNSGVAFDFSPASHTNNSSVVSVEYCNLDTFLTEEGNFSGNPGFVNEFEEDFRLANSSNCVDTGNPSAIYLDIDGTRNDVGAYGGQKGDW